MIPPIPSAPTDRPIFADWILTNPNAPEWSEKGQGAIYWNFQNKCWVHFLNGLSIQQATCLSPDAIPDVMTITSWREYHLPIMRAIAIAEGRNN